MSENIRKFLPILPLVVLITVVVAQPPVTLGQAAVDASFQPVVVPGAALDVFLDTPVAELFVYAYQDEVWRQVPYQIDERALNEDDERVYTAEGDGLLDGDEELVVMFQDMGQPAPPWEWVEGADAGLRVEVEAEAGTGRRRWVYVFQSSELAQTFDQDYVRFSGAAQRIIAERYQAGFLENGAGVNELRLNGSGVDILDRTKIRLEVVVRVFGVPVARRTCNEDNLTTEEGCGLEPQPVSPVKDGPVRLVMGESGGFAYGGLFQQHTDTDLSDLPIPGDVSIEHFRFSWDFNQQAVATTTPTTYLDDNLEEPAVIDGQPDAVPETPFSPWRQVSHATGTLIVAADLSTVGGTQRNYYKDNATADPDDTGDGRSYGDTGFFVEDPNEALILDTSLLVLPPATGDVGEAYAALLATPPVLTVSSQARAGPPDHRLYLPLIRR